MTPFKNRHAAGQALAAALKGQFNAPDVLVLALPRGGVPVAAAIADALNAPLDVINVRKLGVPWQPELAMGALAEGGGRYLNSRLIESLGISDQQINQVIERETATLERRAVLFRDSRPPPDIAGRRVILVDDGVATGATMEAAIQAVRAKYPKDILVALPVGPKGTVRHFVSVADQCLCLMEPAYFQAVGNWYQDFGQTSDDEVIGLLEEAHAKRQHAPGLKTSNNTNSSSSGH